MPKKHRYEYLDTKPKYVHPSLSSGKQAPGSSPSNPATVTVNERLSQLRIAQASPASNERKRQLAEAINQKSLPPSLGQGILGHAPTTPPRPRPEVRSRIRLRTPGPAPPPSWAGRGTPLRQISPSRYRRAGPSARSFGKKTVVERWRPDELGRFLYLAGERFPRKGSLVDSSLRTAAENWDAIVEDCSDDLVYLPAHLRLMLLSYISRYGAPGGIAISDLQALLPGREEATCLDLSGLAGWGFTLKELRKWLEAAPGNATTVHTADAPPPAADEIAESWDQEVSEQRPTLMSPAMSSRLPFLTKLSLANPPSSISWSSLLSLSKGLGTLTHLSLAHWPIPTRTPNMKTASYVSRIGAEHAAGGTSLYSAIDRDFEEPAIVLRQLSENTYCLRWLELKGCAEWIEALTWSGGQSPSTNTATVTATDDDENNNNDDDDDDDDDDDYDDDDAEWQHTHAVQGPDWCGAWRNITYLNTSQECIPQDLDFLNSHTFRGLMAERHFQPTRTHLQIISQLRTPPSSDSRPERNEKQSRDPSHDYPTRNDARNLPGNHQTHCFKCHAHAGRKCDGACSTCRIYQVQETAKMAHWLEREASAWHVGRSINAARAGGRGGTRCTFDHGWQQKTTYSGYG